MFDIRTLLILIPALPLAATLLTAALGKHVLRTRSHLPVVLAIAASCAASVLLVFAVQRDRQQLAAHSGAEKTIGYFKTVPLWTWASVSASPLPSGEGQGVRASALESESQARPHPSPLPEGEGTFRPHPSPTFHVDVVLRADPLTAVMLATVTFISLLVAVYSIGYMRGDVGYWRFFTYIGLFVFSMTMLVSASNFLLLYVFWEAVGLCSYLLIGFWFEKPAAAAAGLKAFLVNRVGDFGFALGIFFLWITYGTLDFEDTTVAGVVHAGIFGQTMLHNPSLYVGGGLGTAICLLLMAGACGKSAQFPLHVWLPDAMEGPTPVSALIHAATMVTAGVYMVARCTPLFAASADAQCVVATIGGFTALLAALIALTQTDLKRILAYSTISQLGYMFLALGVGTLSGISAGMFHLVTHAFFKALLFLGAGAVMHAMGGVIDISRFGGLRRRLPTTHWTFLFGCLALAGIFPFAGFWSKDAILAAVWQQAATHPAHGLYYVLYLAGVATAGLTALYAFRAFFLTFYGEERIPAEAGRHAHEAPPSMTAPMVILAVGALCVGAYFHWMGDFSGPRSFLAQTPSLASPAAAAPAAAEGHSDWNVALASTLAALAGVVLAAVLYLGSRKRVEMLTRVMAALGLYGLSRGKFFFDPLYRALVIWPLEGLARLDAWIDTYVIDGLVNLIGAVPAVFGAMLRPLQGGLVQFYALAMVLGLLALIGALLM
ncbi:MAG: NADH-quinone oxidoreductase subunit L [Thermoguttaceae bacterium]